MTLQIHQNRDFSSATLPKPDWSRNNFESIEIMPFSGHQKKKVVICRRKTPIQPLSVQVIQLECLDFIFATRLEFSG